MKIVSCTGVDGCAVAGEAFEDVFGGLGPYERPRVLVPCGRPCFDVGGESLTLRWAERCNFLVVSAENQRSTRFIHERRLA
jgi:hypothetical protein